MNELDNQVEDKDYDLLAIDTDNVDLTDEAEEVEVDEEQEEVETQEEIEPASSDVVEEPIELLEDLEVKYLHDVKKLKDIPKDELKTLVQKGMNHDRLVEKLEGYKVLDEKMSDFDEIASFYGMDTEALKESLLQQWYENKAEQEGLTAEIVKREHQLGKKEKATQLGDKETQRQTKMMKTFVEKHPNVKDSDIKHETWAKVNNGMDITQAYELQIRDDEASTLKAKIAELEGKLKTNTQNAEVKKKAVVKSTTTNGSDDPDKNDDFLQGLFGN